MAITIYPSLPVEEPLSYDGLPTTEFKIVFPKLPTVTLFLQSFDVPALTINVVSQESRYLNIQQVGEKINYSPFSFTFLCDKSLAAYFEIYKWMQRITVNKTWAEETDNPYLIMGSKGRTLTFMNAWPMSLDGLQFKANEDDLVYITGTATFNYDYFTVDGYSGIEGD